MSKSFNSMELLAALELFVAHCNKVLNLSSHTIRAYSSDLKCFMLYIESLIDCSDVDKHMLRGYINHLRGIKGLKETSIKRKMATLKVFFSWIREEGFFESNPFDGLKEKIRLPKRLPRAIEYDNLKKIKLIANKVQNQNNSFDNFGKTLCISILVETGLRIGELVTAEVDKLNCTEKSIRIVGKGNRERKVYIFSDDVFSALKKYISERRLIQSECPFIFITSHGKKYSTQRVRRFLHDLTARAGILGVITPHMLRHTSATLWLESGVDIRYVQKLLGHQSISTTEIYAHASEEGIRKALLRTQKNRRFLYDN